MNINLKDESISMLRWLVSGLSRKQEAVLRAAEQKIRQLRGLIDKLSESRNESEKAIREQVFSLQRRLATSVLVTLPIEELQEYSSGVRLSALRKAGLNFVGSIAFKSLAELGNIRGIGPQSARQIAQACKRIVSKVNSIPFRMPGPDSVTNEHRRVLKALYKRVRCRTVPRERIEALEYCRSHLSYIVYGIEKERRFLKRIFATQKSKADLEARFEELAFALNAPALAQALSQARDFIEEAKPPSSSEELKADYRSRFAEYSSILDMDYGSALNTTSSGPRQTLDSYPGASNRPPSSIELSHTTVAPRALSKFGGVPSHIAQQVEKVRLELSGLDVDLRGYQKFGAQYIIHQKKVILGDEMGLGKTIQAMAAMMHLYNIANGGRFLVVCPASIVGNWLHELEYKTNLRRFTLHGPLRDQEMQGWGREGGVAVTSFATFSRYLKGIEAYQTDLLIVDEAHYVKNSEAQRSKSVVKQATTASHILLMTGTALENNADEFVNLIKSFNPELAQSLHPQSRIMRHSPSEVVEASTFETLVASVYLRRKQSDVLHELPDCIEHDDWVLLTASERENYKAAVEAGEFMTLRRTVNGTSTNSAKFSRLRELLEFYREDGKKVVVFSYYLDTLDLAGRVAGAHARIDGKVPANQRMALIDRFNKTNGYAVLLGQIGAAGVGINLQSASAVIIIEPQLKPTTEWQAIKRVHRMGQSSRVIVHRLLARDSVDERIQAILSKKSAIFNQYADESAMKSSSTAATDTRTISADELMAVEYKMLSR